MDGDLRTNLHTALAAARQATEAFLRAAERYGRASAEAAAAHEQVRQAHADLIRHQRAYLASATLPPPPRCCPMS